MFKQVTIHRGLTRNKLDIGMLAETLLFYDSVILLLDRGSLHTLIDTLDKDTIIRLVDEFGLKLSYHRDAFGTITSTNNGVSVNNFTNFRIGGRSNKKVISTHQEIEDVIVRKLGSNRQARQLAKEVISRTSGHILKKEDAKRLIDGARNDLLDQRYIQDATKTAISILAPTAQIDQSLKFKILDLADNGFIIDTNLDFSELNAAYRLVPGQEEGSLTDSLLTTYIFGARADAYFASHYMSGYVCDALSSSLMKRRFLDLIRRRERDAAEIDLFQEKTFNGKNVREAINTGNASFNDMLSVIAKGRKFKDWLDTRNPDESLLEEYFREVSKESWIQSLPGKTIRWVTAAGLGAAASAAFSPLEGTLAGLGIGAIDTFFVDQLLRGWRPDQFVEGVLMNFTEGKP